MFRFNQLRPEIVAEVARRVVQARRAAAHASEDESVAYVLNDLAIHELGTQ